MKNRIAMTTANLRISTKSPDCKPEKQRIMKIVLLQILLTSFFYCNGQNIYSSADESFFNKMLISYNTGSIDSINTFISNYYMPVVLEMEGSFEKISYSYGSLYDEFGQLELHSSIYDSTYKSTKYFLKGKYTKEWVAIMLVISKAGDKIAGQGIWKLQYPEGISETKISIKKLPSHLRAHLTQLSENKLFSGTVLIAHKGKVIFHEAYGLKNEGNKVTINTKMPIASITKLFTGIAISQLIAQGKISAHDNISKYIHEYPKDISNQVTIKHLLNHTSGIEIDDCKSYMDSLPFCKNIDDLIKLQVVFIDSLNEGRRVNFKPLNYYDYSNEEYHLLGAIIERVSGISFEEYVIKNICTPLRLKNTNFEVDSTVIGYSHYNNKSEYLPTKWFQYRNESSELKTPSGGMFSTTMDLFQLFTSINKAKLSNLSWKELTSDTVTIAENNFYGYGIEGKEFNTYYSYGHNGGTIKGVNAEFRYFPNEDFFIAIICNRSRTASDLLYYLTNRLKF